MRTMNPVSVETYHEKVEEWRKIELFPNYEISSLGRVKNIKHGNYLKILSNKRHDYKTVMLCEKGKVKNARLHRQVALAFIPNPENKPCVNHKNGNKADNRAENLEWSTIAENNLHAYETGLKPIGEDHHYAKLTGAEVEAIRRIGDLLSSRQLGKMFNISKTNILDIRKGKIWRRS